MNKKLTFALIAAAIIAIGIIGYLVYTMQKQQKEFAGTIKNNSQYA